ncbi:MAG: YwbE family protein [Thermodesulfobacteriota bacterium]
MKNPYNRDSGEFSDPIPCRADIRPGLSVLIVLKKDQKTNKLTRGIVKDILTKSSTHPHGIKVRLEGGEVGRVKQIQG